MAASAVALLTDPAHHQAVTEAALAAVLRRFCANAIVPLYVEFYSQVIDRELDISYGIVTFEARFSSLTGDV